MSVIQHLQKNAPTPAVAEALQKIGQNIGGKQEIDTVCMGVPGYVPAQTYDNVQPLQDGQVTIVNYVTQSEANAGHYGHWICIDNRPKGSILYLDPYGLKPDSARSALHLAGGTNLKQKLNASKGNKMLFINKTQYQDLVPHDDACGAWCSLFVTDPYDPSKEIYRSVPPSAFRDLQLEQQLKGGSK